MRKVVIAAAVAAACALVVTGSRPAAADILVNISKTSQRMSVLVDGTSRYNWMVSTGAKRYTTPSGVYQPQWLARKWRSKQYGNAPMPHSIFFHEGYAIHGTTEVARLGKIASHGCVRLHPDNAATLYGLVQKQMANTRVVVSDDVIEAPGEAPKKKPSQFVAENATGEPPADRKVALKAPGEAPKQAPRPLVAENATGKESADSKIAPEAAGETPTKKSSQSVAENAAEESADGKIALQARALVPQEAPMPASRLAAEKTDSRDTTKPKPTRTEKVARVRSGGFHW